MPISPNQFGLKSLFFWGRIGLGNPFNYYRLSRPFKVTTSRARLISYKRMDPIVPYWTELGPDLSDNTKTLMLNEWGDKFGHNRL